MTQWNNTNGKYVMSLNADLERAITAEELLVGIKQDMRAKIKSSKANNETIPNAVLSLLGAAEPSDSNDQNGRDAYYQYLEEKYK